jgi:hypothetical protein
VETKKGSEESMNSYIGSYLIGRTRCEERIQTDAKGYIIGRYYEPIYKIIPIRIIKETEKFVTLSNGKRYEKRTFSLLATIPESGIISYDGRTYKLED